MASENFKSNLITGLVVGVGATPLAPVLHPFLINASGRLPKRPSRTAFVFALS